jgi:hypothetical protein
MLAASLQQRCGSVASTIPAARRSMSSLAAPSGEALERRRNCAQGMSMISCVHLHPLAWQLILCLYTRRRHWPNEQVQWAKGSITDFKPSTNQHTIVYDIDTADESYEEVNLG